MLNSIGLQLGFRTDPDVDTVYYLTQRMKTSGKEWAKFLRYWKEKTDSSCLGMNVLEVEKEVFIGFKKKEG